MQVYTSLYEIAHFLFFYIPLNCHCNFQSVDLQQRLASCTEEAKAPKQEKVASTLTVENKKYHLTVWSFFYSFSTRTEQWQQTVRHKATTLSLQEKKQSVLTPTRPNIHSLPGLPALCIYLNAFPNWVHRGGCNLIWFCQKHFFFFQGTISPCSPNWPRTHYVDQVSLKLVAIRLP